MRIRTCTAVIAISALVSCTSNDFGESFDSYAVPLLKKLNSSLAGRQNNDPRDADYGGLLCPRCLEYHTRSAEAVYPFAYEGSVLGDSVRLRQSVLLGNWLLGRQNADGSWFESPRTGWPGTTADQLLALAKAYPLVSPILSPEQRVLWKDGIIRAADYLASFMSIKVAYINYCATTAYSLVLADKLFQRSDHMETAMKLARFCISRINEDGLLEGEGDIEGEVKTGVDIGYNMEMSLWGLLGYADIAGDEIVRESAIRSAFSHSCFIYPEGWLDCSIGLRSCKWTLYGSATADGALPLYVAMAERDASFLKAAIENIRAMGQCFSASGLLAPGPDYDLVSSEPPCIYHSFTRAKGLSLAMEKQCDVICPDIASYERDTLVYYKTLNSVVVKKGNVKTTICAYNYKSSRARFMHRPSGGAVTMLWEKGKGLVRVSSPNKYFRWEDSFPVMPEDPRSFTSRIELLRDGKTFTNLYEYDASLEITNQSQVSVRGLLKSAEGETCGVDYEILYSFDESGLSIQYKVSDPEATVVEPVLDKSGRIRQYFPSVCCREEVSKPSISCSTLRDPLL